jgi:hypothetical protein
MRPHQRAREINYELPPLLEPVNRRQGSSPKVAARGFKLVASAVIVAASILHARAFQTQAALSARAEDNCPTSVYLHRTGMKGKDA